MSKYDSTKDTIKHIGKVKELGNQITNNIFDRMLVHDNSKLESPEKETFDEYTPKLASSTYGSSEYKGYLKGMKVALDHHYYENSHHPEHFKNGISGMSLIDLIEMLTDWKAPTLRHDNGDILKSIELNQERFGYTD
ncbi:hypothetical protein KAU11_09395, partial [Candidatus Babeliales bacterium]|nr:hypothetical protein [Candidatus Babeliales bacterium]